MDNFFTWPKTIMAVTDHNVATVGTARYPSFLSDFNEVTEKKKEKDKGSNIII